MARKLKSRNYMTMLDESTEALTVNEKFFAAICYPIPLVSQLFAIIFIIKTAPQGSEFVKYHAYHSLVLSVLLALLSVITIDICAPLFLIVPLFPAYESFRGRLTKFPFITEFILRNDWL